MRIVHRHHLQWRLTQSPVFVAVVLAVPHAVAQIVHVDALHVSAVELVLLATLGLAPARQASLLGAGARMLVGRMVTEPTKR